MTSLTKELAHLSSLMRQYLAQEHAESQFLMTDRETYGYYQQYYKENSSVRSKLPIPAPIENKKTAMAPSFPKIEPAPCASPPPVFKPPTPAASVPTQTPPSKFLPGAPLETKDIDVIFSKHFSALKAVDQTPEEILAKHVIRMKPENNVEVIVLVRDESPEERAFLEKLTHAIHSRLCPATLFSLKDRSIEEISSFSRLKSIVGLKEYLSAVTTEGKLVVPLEKLENYFKNQTLKAELWNFLCKNFPV